MYKLLNESDLPQISDYLFYKYQVENIDYIKNSINKDAIYTADMVDNKIKNMLVARLHNDSYNIETLPKTSNQEEVRELLKFTMEELKKTNMSNDFYYDSSTYDDYENNILLSLDFVEDYMNFRNSDKVFGVEKINHKILLGDYSKDVAEYLYNSYQKVLKSNYKYHKERLEQDKSITLEDVINNIASTNILVVRNNNQEVIGSAKFTLVGETMFINTIYAEEETIYIDLIKSIKNLTDREIEIGVFPIRKDLINILNCMNFKKTHVDYIYHIK